MKKPEIKECNLSDFNQILEQKSVARFSVPSYQRGYSWDTKNWKWFLQSAKKVSESNQNLSDNEERDIWFIGNIILQKGEDNNYNIIDGQQRLITIFILLSVIYYKIAKMASAGSPENQSIQKQIKHFLFSDSPTNSQLRIELSEVDNPFDKENFRKNILRNCENRYPDQEKAGRDSISKASRFFANEINTRNYLAIYQTIVNDFYFSLMIMDKGADAGELFMALNKTALDLTIADLVKSLFITREVSQSNRSIISRIWNEKIVQKVCVAPKDSSNYKKSQEILSFLTAFREAKFGERYKGSWRIGNELYEFFENQIEAKPNLLNWMIEYAEIYHKMKNVLDYQTWWKEQWSSEIVFLIADFLLLDYFWLLSYSLAVYFRLHDKDSTQKETAIKELRTMLLFYFRVVTIKGKMREEKPLWEIRGESLKKLVYEDRNNPISLLFDNENQWVNVLFREFATENYERFYNEELNKWEPEKRNREAIQKFILRTYYHKKIAENRNISQEKKIKMKEEILKYNLEYLGERKDEAETELLKDNLGNLILLNKNEVENRRFSRQWDNEKRNFLEELGENCLMNFLEEKKWIEVEDFNQLIEDRKRYLMNEFKRLKIFEPD